MAGKNNALQKPVNLSPELENVVGKGPMTRAQVTSKVWDHIKAKLTSVVVHVKEILNVDRPAQIVYSPTKVSWLLWSSLCQAGPRTL